jgi:hypothetical protein
MRSGKEAFLGKSEENGLVVWEKREVRGEKMGERDMDRESGEVREAVVRNFERGGDRSSTSTSLDRGLGMDGKEKKGREYDDVNGG